MKQIMAYHYIKPMIQVGCEYGIPLFSPISSSITVKTIFLSKKMTMSEIKKKIIDLFIDHKYFIHDTDNASIMMGDLSLSERIDLADDCYIIHGFYFDIEDAVKINKSKIVDEIKNELFPNFVLNKNLSLDDKTPYENIRENIISFTLQSYQKKKKKMNI